MFTFLDTVLLVAAMFMLSSMGNRLRSLEEKINWLGRSVDRIDEHGLKATLKMPTKAVEGESYAAASISNPTTSIAAPEAPVVPGYSLSSAHTTVMSEVHVPRATPIPAVTPVPPPQYRVVSQSIDAQGTVVKKVEQSMSQSPLVSQKVNRQYEPDPVARLAAWLKEDFMLKLGGFFVLLGMLWLAKLAADAGLYTPLARIMTGMLIGITTLIYGWARMRERVNQGSTFLVLGAAIFIGTTYVGRSMFHMYEPGAALLLMFLASAFVSFVSVAYKNKSLAVTSLISALAVPMLAGGEENYVGLFAYLFAVTLGALIMIRLTRFRVLIVVAQVSVLFYSIPAMFNYTAEAVLGVVYAFAAMFLLASLVPQLEKRMIPENEWSSEITIGVLNVVMLLWWVLERGPGGWSGIDGKAAVLTAWALVFAFGGFLVARVRRDATPYLMQMIPSGLLIGIATYLQFGHQEALLALLWAGEITVLLELLLLRAPRKGNVVGWSILYVVPLVELLSLYGNRFFDENSIPTMSLISFIGTLVLVASTSSRYVRAMKTEGSLKAGEASLAHVWVGIALLNSLFGVWKFAQDFFNFTGGNGSVAVGFSLTIYTLMGLPLLIIGKLRGDRSRWWAGVCLLSFVSGHLLLVDVWSFDPVPRVFTFIVIGVLFMSTAFIGKKKTEHE